jgi:hypothetical protein
MENEMARTCSTGESYIYKIFMGKPEGSKTLERADVDEII